MNQVILDFIENNYFVIVYGITWFISAITYKKYFDTLLKYFPIIIAYTFFNELLGGLIANNDNYQIVFEKTDTVYNYIIYNLYHFSFFLYFYILYQKVIINLIQKNYIKYGIYFFVLINIINIIFQNPLINFFIFPYLFGVIFLIYCLIIYFKQTLKTYTMDLLKYNLLFWVSLGLLVFHIIYLPLKIFREFKYELYIPFRHFHLSMIVLMYVIFSIGFIVCKRKAFR